MTDISCIAKVLRDNGLFVDSIICDDKIHRCQSLAKDKKNLDGWYTVKEYSGEYYCYYGCWIRGFSERFSTRPEATNNGNSHEIWKFLNEIQKRDEIERKRNAVKSASAFLSQCESASGHPYLDSKNINDCGAMVNGDNLVIKAVNSEGDAVGYQTISKTGEKRFMTGSVMKGASFTIYGDANVVCICEGFATGATIHKATGYMVVCAFSSGNLPVIVGDIVKKHQKSKVIVCADNDHHNNHKQCGNAGLKAAKKAKDDHGVDYVFPEGIIGTDFNDMAVEKGIDAVKSTIIKSVSVKVVTREDIKDDSISLNLTNDIIDPGGLISLGMKAFSADDIPNIVQYNFPLVLSVIARAITGKIKFGNVWPNFYNIKVGGTSTGKTDADKAMKQAIKLSGITDFYGPTDFSSGPGLLRGLSEYPQCLITLDEISYLFKRFDKPDMNSAGKISALLELYTSTGHQLIKTYGDSKNKIIINNPCVNIIGNATPGIFSDLKPDDLESGLIQRFDFWCYDGDIPYRNPFSGDQNRNLDIFVKNIAEIISIENENLPDLFKVLNEPTTIIPDSKCREILNDFSVDIINRANSEDNAGAKGIISRGYHLSVKYAMLHMASERVSTGLFEPMTEKDLEYGIKLSNTLINWKLKVLLSNISEGEFHKLCQDFKSGIKIATKNNMAPTGAVIANKKKSLKNITPRIWDDIVKVLSKRNEIFLDETGRSTKYFLVKE